EKISKAGGLPTQMENVDEIRELLGMEIEDPLVYFNDPETRSTLAMPLSHVSEASVRRHMAESREKFRGKAKAAAPSQLFQSYGFGMSPEELEKFVKSAGRNIRIEDYGEQGDLFQG